MSQIVSVYSPNVDRLWIQGPLLHIQIDAPYSGGYVMRVYGIHESDADNELARQIRDTLSDDGSHVFTAADFGAALIFASPVTIHHLVTQVLNEGADNKPTIDLPHSES